MNKKFLSVILFSALMLGTAGTFTSCKDYDDDIKDLQGQLDKKASLDELNSKVSTLESSIAEAKTAAAAAKTAADEAKTKAQEALDKAVKIEANLWGDKKYTVPMSLLLSTSELDDTTENRSKNNNRFIKAFSALQDKAILLVQKHRHHVSFDSLQVHIFCLPYYNQLPHFHVKMKVLASLW